MGNDLVQVTLGGVESRTFLYLSNEHGYGVHLRGVDGYLLLFTVCKKKG